MQLPPFTVLYINYEEDTAHYNFLGHSECSTLFVLGKVFNVLNRVLNWNWQKTACWDIANIPPIIYFMDFTHTRATLSSAIFDLSTYIANPFLTSHQETIFLQAINIIKDYYWQNLHHYKSPMKDKFFVLCHLED
jgi:hypothetical protein